MSIPWRRLRAAMVGAFRVTESIGVALPAPFVAVWIGLHAYTVNSLVRGYF